MVTVRNANVWEGEAGIVTNQSRNGALRAAPCNGFGRL